jgi:hypothetical protein
MNPDLSEEWLSIFSVQLNGRDLQRFGGSPEYVRLFRLLVDTPWHEDKMNMGSPEFIQLLQLLKDRFKHFPDATYEANNPMVLKGNNYPIVAEREDIDGTFFAKLNGQTAAWNRSLVGFKQDRYGEGIESKWG